MSFRQAMDRRMEELEIKPIELSRRSGVSRAYISMLEHGKIKEPSFEFGRKISEALGLTMDEMASRAYDKPEH
jgi:transcriptional regulator with XRE-family HTH domain